MIPVTIKQPEDVSIKTLNNKEDLDTNKSVVNLLITGSLWYGPNYDGIKWVIKNVLPLIKGSSGIPVGKIHSKNAR